MALLATALGPAFAVIDSAPGSYDATRKVPIDPGPGCYKEPSIAISM
jgi:hypothetical protein